MTQRLGVASVGVRVKWYRRQRRGTNTVSCHYVFVAGKRHHVERERGSVLRGGKGKLQSMANYQV